MRTAKSTLGLSFLREFLLQKWDLEIPNTRVTAGPISCRGRAAFAVFWQVPREENHPGVFVSLTSLPYAS